MYAFINSEASDEIMSPLKKEGFYIVPIPPFPKLAGPVSTHTDMLMFSCESTVFLPKDYVFPDMQALKTAFENIIYINEPFSEKYPNDVRLNIALVGNDVFVNVKYASKTVLEYLYRQGKKIHHVAQGYAHCSVCILSDEAIITSDSGIADCARKAGKDVLVIEKGNVSLPPYNYGFIGGASGCVNGKVYFCGSYHLHPSKDSIDSFCKKHGVTPVSLGSLPLSDVGGILFA